MEEQPNEVKTEVTYVRMITGEDIITQLAQVGTDDDMSYIFINPVKIVYTVGGTSSIGISMMEWIFNKICKEQCFYIAPTDILTTGAPADDIIEYYWECVKHFSKKNDMQLNTNPKDMLDNMHMSDAEMEDFDEDITEENMSAIQDFIKSSKRTLH